MRELFNLGLCATGVRLRSPVAHNFKGNSSQRHWRNKTAASSAQNLNGDAALRLYSLVYRTLKTAATYVAIAGYSISATAKTVACARFVFGITSEISGNSANSCPVASQILMTLSATSFRRFSIYDH